MIISYYLGRLGNQMFQYAFGRIIADKKGYQMECQNHDEIRNPSVLQKYFPNATPVIEGIRTQATPLHCGYTCPAPHHLFQHLDMDTVLNHKGMVVLHGYWQKHWYYPQYAEQIKKWFQYDDSTHMKPEKNDIVVHFRLGDIVAEGRSISPKIFIDIISKMDYDRCIIVTDTKDSPVLNEFGCLKDAFISEGGLMEDFTLMKHAKRLFMSQSTLSWWAAFLGDQEKVYVPMYINPPPQSNGWGINPAKDDIELVPPSEKFTKIEV